MPKSKIKPASDQERTAAADFVDMRLYNFVEELIVEAEAAGISMTALHEVLDAEMDTAFVDVMSKNFPEE
jgi:hypothetical protein